MAKNKDNRNQRFLRVPTEPNKKSITKDMVIGDIISKHPGSPEILMKHGMQCIGCHVATWETLEQAAAAHGIDVDKLLKELNKGDKK